METWANLGEGSPFLSASNTLAEPYKQQMLQQAENYEI